MDKATTRGLADLTRGFYDESARGFIAAHELPARGWARVLDLLGPHWPAGTVSVLDVGCGNGRLAVFLQRALRRPFVYLGLDASPSLVALARERCRGVETARFEVLDLVDLDLDRALDGETFSAVAAFGVIHHIPSLQRRRAFVEGLGRQVAPGGTLVISTWRVFSEYHFHGAVRPWEDENHDADRRIDVRQLESGDYLLAPSGGEMRYCHLVTEGELAGLHAGMPVICEASFLADGPRDQMNRYVVLRKDSRRTNPTEMR